MSIFRSLCGVERASGRELPFTYPGSVPEYSVMIRLFLRRVQHNCASVETLLIVFSCPERQYREDTLSLIERRSQIAVAAESQGKKTLLG